MKKILSVLLAVALMLGIFGVFSTAEETKKLVVLGDSIAWGTGVYNSEQACYGRIVADTLGYEYVNYGVNGNRTADLLEKLSWNNVAADVKDADIISISIGGNDYLQQNLLVLIPEILVGNNENMDNIEKIMADNFASIIQTIRSYNPDALVLVNELYNPEQGLLGVIYGAAVERVNRVIHNYLNDNPDSFVLLDVTGVMNNHPECVAFDTIHPSAVGNERIAGVFLQKLADLGVCEYREPVINTIGIDEIPFTSYIASFFVRCFLTVYTAVIGAFQ